jgi:hypothetical protein
MISEKINTLIQYFTLAPFHSPLPKHNQSESYLSLYFQDVIIRLQK